MTANNLPAPASNALELSQPQLAQYIDLADRLQKAEGMIPKVYLGAPGKILAAILAGYELGVGPMASLRSFHVVEGKPVASAAFWVARLKNAGYRVIWKELSSERVVLELIARDGLRHIETWDKARAVQAGLWNSKDNWKKYPQEMLQARAITSAGRAFASEVMFGCYDEDEREEIVDLGSVPAATATPSTPTTAPATTAAEAIGAKPADAAELERQARTKALHAILLDAQYTSAEVKELLAEAGIPDKRISQLTIAEVTAVEATLEKPQHVEEPSSGG